MPKRACCGTIVVDRSAAVPKGAKGAVATPVDAFILDKLAAAGLEQAPRATPRALIRRLSLDFASPDVTAAERSTTMVPQQALFGMNHPFVIERARAVCGQEAFKAGEDAAKAKLLYRALFQRPPTQRETLLATEFVRSTPRGGEDDRGVWRYGCGDPAATSGSPTSTATWCARSWGRRNTRPVDQTGRTEECRVNPTPMDSASFLGVASDWSHWDAPPPPTVPRSGAGKLGRSLRTRAARHRRVSRDASDGG
jgi:hypothetical protein